MSLAALEPSELNDVTPPKPLDWPGSNFSAVVAVAVVEDGVAVVVGVIENDGADDSPVKPPKPLVNVDACGVGVDNVVLADVVAGAVVLSPAVNDKTGFVSVDVVDADKFAVVPKFEPNAVVVDVLNPPKLGAGVELPVVAVDKGLVVVDAPGKVKLNLFVALAKGLVSKPPVVACVVVAAVLPKLNPNPIDGPVVALVLDADVVVAPKPPNVDPAPNDVADPPNADVPPNADAPLPRLAPPRAVDPVPNEGADPPPRIDVPMPNDGADPPNVDVPVPRLVPPKAVDPVPNDGVAPPPRFDDPVPNDIADPPNVDAPVPRLVPPKAVDPVPNPMPLPRVVAGAAVPNAVDAPPRVVVPLPNVGFDVDELNAKLEPRGVVEPRPPNPPNPVEDVVVCGAVGAGVEALKLNVVGAGLLEFPNANGVDAVGLFPNVVAVTLGAVAPKLKPVLDATFVDEAEAEMPNGLGVDVVAEPKLNDVPPPKLNAGAALFPVVSVVDGVVVELVAAIPNPPKVDAPPKLNAGFIFFISSLKRNEIILFNSK